MVKLSIRNLQDSCANEISKKSQVRCYLSLPDEIAVCRQPWLILDDELSWINRMHQVCFPKTLTCWW